MPVNKKRKKPAIKSAKKLVDITTLLKGGKSLAKNKSTHRKRGSRTKVIFEPIDGLNEEISASNEGFSDLEQGTAPNSGPGTAPNTGPGTAPGTGPGTGLMS
jgi:hypothetical protein